MLLFPKRVKHRKWQTNRSNPAKQGVTTRGSDVSFGSFGIKALDHGRITSRQIEAARMVASRSVGKFGKIWIRIFPDMPVTKKPPEVKLGGGKGDVDTFCAPVEPGRVLLEIDNVSSEVAREALRKAGAKLPVKTKFVSREH